MPSAFTTPIRMICQYKFYAKNRVELSHIRDFYGIITDINENRYLGVDKMKIYTIM